MTRGDRVINWIHRHLIVPEGRLYGQPVRLLPWQQADIRKIYDNPHGPTRRAIFSFARKNGKTALAAMLTLVHLCGPEARANSQLYSAAQSREQAAVLFDLAAKMVRLSPSLNAYVGVRDNKKELYVPELGTEYKALSAEAKTKFGLSPVFIVHDELGQVKGPRSKLYTALETATAAQLEPLSVIISTQAPTDNDLLSRLIDDGLGKNLKEGEQPDPRTVVSLYTAPVDADPFCEATIRLANPGYGILQNTAELLDMMGKAQRMPADEAEYRNLVLNQRVEVNAPLFPRAVWDACNTPVPAMPPPDVDAYMGFDLSEVNDLTAMVLLWHSLKLDKWMARPFFWLPADGIEDRSRADRVPYALWAEQGYIELCPGKAVSYEWCANRVAGMLKQIRLKAAGFDRYNWRHFEPWLKAAKVKASLLAKFEPVGMGSQSMGPALRTLETDVLQQTLAHGGHPVLNMCVANSRVTKDQAGNRRLDKHVSRGRIDGAVALAIARAVAAEHHRDKSTAGIKLI